MRYQGAASAAGASDEIEERAPISVLCVDDHPGFRKVVSDVIAATAGFVLIGEASSGTEAIAIAPQLRPDLVLMDVNMPGMSGFEAATLLRNHYADLLIVLMSVDQIDVPPGFALPGRDLAFVGKRELCPRRLREIWHGRSSL